MLRYGWEIYQTLIKMFARTNKRFPNSKEIKWIENQAIRIKDKLLGTGVNLEKMSAEEAIQFYAKPPKRTTRPPKEYAGIEALPLDNPELKAQALKKALDARNQQALEKLRSKLKSGEIKKGAAPKTDLKKVKDKVETDKKTLEDLKDQIPTKGIDDDLDFKDGGPVDKKDEDTVPLKPDEFDEIFRKMFSEWEWEKKKDSWKDKDYADGGLATLFEER